MRRMVAELEGRSPRNRGAKVAPIPQIGPFRVNQRGGRFVGKILYLLDLSDVVN